MPTALRPIGHEDRLSLVDHLDELRTRLIICVVVLIGVSGVCFWQNDAILDALNRPLERTAFKEGDDSKDPFEQTARSQAAQKQLDLQLAVLFRQLANDEQDGAQAAIYRRVAATARAAAAASPAAQARKPVTLGVGEPFNATIRVTLYAALLISLPLLLYQFYAFILPAFSPRERSVAIPLMLMVPFLFVGGVCFGYFALLPPAIDFLQNFNDDQFDILLQARDYYKFAILVLMAMGLVFQIPVGMLAVTRVGIISVKQLRANRRYAIVIIAVLAMLLPGADPVTYFICFFPLLLLFEGSILLCALIDRRAASRGDAEDDDEDEPEPGDGGDDEDPDPDGPATAGPHDDDDDDDEPVSADPFEDDLDPDDIDLGDEEEAPATAGAAEGPPPGADPGRAGLGTTTE